MPPNSLSDDEVETILRDSDGVWWVGTVDGLNRYDPATDSFTRLRHDPNDPDSLGSSNILSLLEDRRGRLWVGHDAGLDAFDRRHRATLTFVDPTTRDEVLDSSPVQSLLEDSTGAIWVGTRTAGAARISPLPSSVEYFRHDPTDRASINSDFVARTVVDDDKV